MIIDFHEIVKNINVKGIIHVGACMGEEFPIYDKYTKNVIWIEANPELIPIIEKNVYGEKVLSYAVCDKDHEKIKFNVIYSDDRTNPGCSSILDLKIHQQLYPMINKVREVEVETITLDTLLKEQNLIPSDYNVLNMDIQGAELLALKGAENLLQHLDIVYTEFSLVELYKDCCLLSDLDEFLTERGFKRTRLEFAATTWGDVVYVKDKSFNS
jgi:FkbM family methyltransferase